MGLHVCMKLNLRRAFYRKLLLYSKRRTSEETVPWQSTWRYSLALKSASDRKRRMPCRLLDHLSGILSSSKDILKKMHYLLIAIRMDVVRSFTIVEKKPCHLTEVLLSVTRGFHAFLLKCINSTARKFNNSSRYDAFGGMPRHFFFFHVATKSAY